MTRKLPKVYTFGMSKNTVINLKTSPELKEKAAKVAERLGISVSAILNNELRRFAAEESVVFITPEMPNAKTRKSLADSRREIAKGDYFSFKNNKKAINFLRSELK